MLNTPPSQQWAWTVCVDLVMNILQGKGLSQSYLYSSFYSTSPIPRSNPTYTTLTSSTTPPILETTRFSTHHPTIHTIAPTLPTNPPVPTLPAHSEGIAVVQLLEGIIKELGTQGTSPIAYHPKQELLLLLLLLLFPYLLLLLLLILLILLFLLQKCKVLQAIVESG